MDLRHETDIALAILRDAIPLSRQIQREMTASAVSKADRSPVTVADYAIQAFVGHALAAAFPHDPLVAEEDAGQLRNGDHPEILDQVAAFLSRVVPDGDPRRICDWVDRGSGVPGRRFWTLDPIDGTKGFLRGQQYAIALALIVDGQVQLGALGCPNLSSAGLSAIGGPGSVFFADNSGSWSQTLGSDAVTRLHVSPEESACAARVLRSLESSHTNENTLDRVVAELGTEFEPVSMDSQAKYAVLAAGQAELLFRLLSNEQPDYREKIWDQAAGAILIERAGGRITDVDGGSLDFTRGRTLAQNRGIVASNGLLHEPALDALRRIRA